MKVFASGSFGLGDRRDCPDETGVSTDERVVAVARPTCKRLGGARRDRTDDLKLAKLALSQLSYGPGFERSADEASVPKSVVGLGRFELPTSRLSSARSNQLSYRPDSA